MKDEGISFEDIVDEVASQYGRCVSRAKSLFTDETAIQSASATMFINATKEKSSVYALQDKLRKKIAEYEKEAIPSAILVWEWHFREFLDEFGPRIKSHITFLVNSKCTPQQIESSVRERVYHLRCEKLSIEDQQNLFKEMFGEEINE